MSAYLRGASQALLLLLVSTFILLPTTVHAAFINFQNCLDTRIVNSDPLQLQWIPLWVNAHFDASHPSHTLNFTIYGNVSGQQSTGPYPDADDPHWSNDDETFGKITNTVPGGNYTTLFTDFKVLNYDAYNAKAADFCNSTVNGTCPLGPSFKANASNPYELHAFSISHDFNSPYSFSTLNGKVHVVSGAQGAPALACITANITPDLGKSVKGLLRWLPVAVLIIKGIATLSAAIWSPWGSSDIFRWSSNYGRDEDLLRLVTPGFGDCLQYIQFVTLTGALSLQYPGFYQPAVSRTGWSLLLFNQSFVSHGNGTQSLTDGIYAFNGTYGMTAMSQLIGMSKTEDIWACMAIWLLVIAVIVAVLCQLGFFGRWIFRKTTKTIEEDLQQKNIPFTMGNMVRLLFNFFILPIVALSLFQLVTAPSSPSVVVAMAVVLLVIMILGGAWILRVIFSTKPRTFLFDDMPIVLLYGPLYNTYSDSAAPFALVPVFITFMRGVALGAIQPSGIAQIIVLAICEVILILTLNGFRPFQGQTSMNAYHTAFAVIRLATILLSVAFIAPLDVGHAAKGWIAYVILFLHACVLVFGFFLNSAQTLIEVIARACGVGGDAQHGAIRGSILNMRMLKKRQDRPITRDRTSMASNAAMLHANEAGDTPGYSGRSRSVSASSHQLLNQNGPPSTHRISQFDPLGSPGGQGDFMTSPTGHRTSHGGFTYLPVGDFDSPVAGVKGDGENFYRPPRARKATMDTMTTGGKNKASGEFPYQDSPDAGRHLRQVSGEAGYGGRETPTPAFFRQHGDGDEGPRPDYAVREVDQYYRGPPLSEEQAGRKLKTGPADPVGPAASAQTWLQKMMYGMKNKKKEPSKGFEVTRSSRLPPGMQSANPEDLEMQTSPPMNQEPYRDSPPAQQGEYTPTAAPQRSIPTETAASPPRFNFGFDGANDAQQTPEVIGAAGPSSTMQSDARPGTSTSKKSQTRSRRSMESGSNYERPSSEFAFEEKSHPAVPTEAPTLGPIDRVGSIHMPSRYASHRSGNTDNRVSAAESDDWLRAVDNLNWNHESQPGGLPQPGGAPRPIRSNEHLQPSPSVPRRSSRRTLSQDMNFQNRRSDHRYDDVFAGFDSGEASPVAEEPESAIEGTPTGNFHVSHHRAADSLTRNSLGSSAAMHGASAEIMDATPPSEHYLGRTD